MNYEEKLQEEAALWGEESVRVASEINPDWREHRQRLINIITHNDDIEALLNYIQPNMNVLELGCASGWLTLATAQQGAHAIGYDISEQSLDVARTYYESIKDSVKGSAHYEKQDLNALELPANHYDVIIVKGTLHHLINMKHVINEIHKGLKSGGLFWISDEDGDVNLRTALFSSGFMFILPTEVSYKDKISGLLKFGINAPSRIKASMEAEDLSPFEGAGREHDWMKLIAEQFTLEQNIKKPAFTGYIAHQIKLPRSIALTILRILRVFDNILVRFNLLQSTGRVVWARKT